MTSLLPSRSLPPSRIFFRTPHRKLDPFSAKVYLPRQKCIADRAGLTALVVPPLSSCRRRNSALKFAPSTRRAPPPAPLPVSSPRQGASFPFCFFVSNLRAFASRSLLPMRAQRQRDQQ
eukprot:1142632-Pleurochrysis_carterae.AAC.1